jgi:hypothetical protein
MITRKVIKIPISADDAIACSPVDRSKILPLYTSYTQTEPSDNHRFRRPPLDRQRPAPCAQTDEAETMTVSGGIGRQSSKPEILFGSRRT